MSMDYEQLIKALNEERNVAFISKDYSSFAAPILLAAGRSVEMIISFPDTFPLTPPLFLIPNLDEFREHVDPKGKICLFDKTSVLFDVEHPEQILIDCFDQAVDILNTPVQSKTFLREMTREFNAYWSYYADNCIDWACDTPQQKYYKTSALWINNRLILANSVDDARYLACNYMKCTVNGSETTIPCTIVSLRNGSAPIWIKKEYQWNEVRRYILNNTSSSARRAFKTFLSNKIAGKKRYMFILICPTEYGNLIFGFNIQFDGFRNETIEHCRSTKLSPIFVRRMDRDHLLIRGGGNPNILSNKKVLLLGCGSVGGFIAANLCQMGIGTIDLLDNDHFSIENVHRHFLGFDSAFNENTGKADLLKARLEQMYPYVDIDALNYSDRSAEHFIQDVERMKCYDIVISALGEPTINLALNRLFVENNVHLPFVVCFNEPYGIGGHIVAVNIDRESCLQCLYTKIDDSEMCAYRASLVAPGQFFKKNLSGCSGAFVPYSVLDSQQTAILASRVVSRILQGTESRSFAEYWTGDGSDLKNAGFITSPLFDEKNGKSAVNRIEHFGNLHCPICRKRKEGTLIK